jgi:DNA-binding response OmpR family regulator/signal transduction histidine kinase
MRNTFFIILISVFAFIAVNTIFYLKIYKDQRDFQTELLLHQISICGNTIEQYGLNFENEVNYILYSNNINQLFNDPITKERGSKNLELFYSKYNRLINHINIYGDQKNVYSLFLDRRNDFVSDYYESQQQIPLLDRDKLFLEEGYYHFAIPVFKENQVHSNIVIEIDFLRYIGSVFDRYKLENSIYQLVITDKKEIEITSDDNIMIDSIDLSFIMDQILEGNEGSLIHKMKIDGENFKMISVYYPVRMIRRNFGIIFSIKTASFLQPIFRKIIIITIASFLLMTLILFIHFRIIQVKSTEAHKHEVSEQLLRRAFDNLPVGIIMVNPDDTIRTINNTAQDFLLLTKKEEATGKHINHIIPSGKSDISDVSYMNTFGEGIIFKVNNGFRENILFRKEYQTEIENNPLKVMVIFDLTYLEKVKTRDHVAQIARSGLIKNMSDEIYVPINKLKDTFNSLKKEKESAIRKTDISAIEKSFDLLENLIKIMIEFSSMNAGDVVIEDIPYQLRNEVILAIETLKSAASAKNISIITKIKNDVPDKLNGDPFRLRQAIFHILENSINNTDKGRILISVEVIDQAVNNIKLKFQIEDTGRGLPVDQINEYLNSGNTDDLMAKGESDATGFKMVLAKQNIELMKGQLWLESPSSISTHPDFPGTKYNFIIEVFPDIIYSKVLDFSHIQNLNEIQCLVLSQINDPEDKSLELLQQIGIIVKQRIYRNDNLDSIIQYLRDSEKVFQMIVILDKPDTDGFSLASRMSHEKLSDLFLILMISSKHNPQNIQLSRKYKIDHYLVQPFESYIILEIIKEHFTGIPDQALTNIPRGFKINQDISILLAEDNLFNRKVNQTLFKSLGFEIDLAQNGNEVLKMVKNKNYHIIFMDILMPELDGFETAVRLRELDFKMPIIALTAVETEDARKKAFENGFNDYLVKPATIEDIRKILLDLFSESA